jgi:hypothetical protein
MKKNDVLLLVGIAFLFLLSVFFEYNSSPAQGNDYEKGYKDGYQNGQDDVYDSIKPIKRPVSGTILQGSKYSGSEITITADGGYDYVVSLKSYSGSSYLSFYVRAGETVTVGVPAKRLYVYFASGKDWYGYGEGLMFGKDTCYSKDDEAHDFTEYTWKYTLYPVTNGNFSETPIDQDDFF